MPFRPTTNPRATRTVGLSQNRRRGRSIVIPLGILTAWEGRTTLPETLSSRMPSKGYLRLKRFRQRRSLERARRYLAKDWEALGTDPKSWTARQCASRKRWWIYYARRTPAQMRGLPLEPWPARHWAGPNEREKKLAKAWKPSVNLALVRHLL